jgi:hypothetical protein
MSKPYVGYIVAPAEYRPTLQALAVQLGDGGAAENNNFNIGFCLPSAPNTIVAYGGSTGPITQAVVDYVEANVIPNLPAGSYWMRCANEAHPARVLKTNYKPAQDQIDAGHPVLFDINAILADIGMILYTHVP